MNWPITPLNGDTTTNEFGTQFTYDDSIGPGAWLITSQVITGITGIQGGTGIQGIGIQGETGISILGETGIQGLTGIQVQGETGIQGFTGLALGSTGLQGVTGFYGQTGIQGETGFYGQTGLQGLVGETGIQGGLGLTGLQGLTGFCGQTGLQGLVGETGIQGLGLTGLQGVTGFYGQTGIQGLVGETGIQGISLTGLQGLTGFYGQTGIQGSYWRSILGTPSRKSNTQFTVTDTNNAGHYDLLLSRGTVIKWEDSTGIRQAMSNTTAYADNDATINIIGDLMREWDFTSANFCYAVEKARNIQFGIPGVVGVLSDAAGRFNTPYAIKTFGVDCYVSTAGSTGITSFDIRYGSPLASLFLTKPYIASGVTSGTGFASDNTVSSIAENSSMQCDVLLSSQTASDAWLTVFFTPENNKYL